MASFDLNGVMQSRVEAVGELYRSKVKQLGAPGDMFARILAERMGVLGNKSDEIPYIKASPSGMEPIVNVETQRAKAASVNTDAAMQARKAQYQPLVAAAATKYGVSAQLINGVIQAESSYRPEVTSSAGARGLMQLMPGTAKEVGVSNSFDAAQNIDGGTQYLKKMIERFNGDVRLALAAYNCGPARVESLGITSSSDAGYQNLSTNVRGYVDRVLRYASA